MAGGLLKFAAFTGRASRREFAVVFLSLVALSLLGLLIQYLAHRSAWTTALLIAFDIVEFWLLAATIVRRMHDLGKSGWLLLFWIVPMAGLIIVIWSLFRPGTVGPNRYDARLAGA